MASFMIDNLLRMNDVGHKKKRQESDVSSFRQNVFPCLSSETNVSNPSSSSRTFQSQVEDKPMKPLLSLTQGNSIFRDNEFQEEIVPLNHVWSTSNDLVTKPLSSSSSSSSFSFSLPTSSSSFFLPPVMDPKIQTLFWQHLLLRRKMSLSFKPRKGGQMRFSQEQTIDLERIFQKNKYISPRDRKRIANQINLTESQVKTWFQNRRAKSKKMDLSSCRPSSDSSSTL